MWWELELKIILLINILLSLLIIIQPHQALYRYLTWIPSLYFIGSFLTSQSYSWKAHWRTCLIASVTLIVSGTSNIDINSRALGIVLFIISAFGLIIILIFPIPSQPELRGKYKRVGTSSFRVPIQLPADAQLYKEVTNYDLNVQCWYPISKTTGFWWNIRNYFRLNSFATLWSSGHPKYQNVETFQLLHHSAASADLPSFLFSHLVLCTTNSEYIDFEKTTLPQNDIPTSATFPIVIYSHGMWSWRQISSSTFEMLASNGYIVFSVDHLPSAMVTRPFPGITNFTAFDYHLPTHIAPGSLDERRYYQKGVDRRCREIIALVDFLHEPHIASKFRLELNQIHVFGHSFGGGTIAGVTCRDNRITSAVLCKFLFFYVLIPCSGLVDVSSGR